MKSDVVQPDCRAECQARWQAVHDLFERLRHVPRSAWHAELNAALPGDPSMAYEVLSLLVADESIESPQVHSRQ